MADRLLTDAERDRLLLAVARSLVVACPVLDCHEGTTQRDNKPCPACSGLRGALQSIEEGKAHG